jgi:hypothetical protein
VDYETYLITGKSKNCVKYYFDGRYLFLEFD